jgi:hypothetical protein
LQKIYRLENNYNILGVQIEILIKLYVYINSKYLINKNYLKYKILMLFDFEYLSKLFNKWINAT